MRNSIIISTDFNKHKIANKLLYEYGFSFVGIKNISIGKVYGIIHYMKGLKHENSNSNI